MGELGSAYTGLAKNIFALEMRMNCLKERPRRKGAQEPVWSQAELDLVAQQVHAPPTAEPKNNYLGHS